MTTQPKPCPNYDKALDDLIIGNHVDGEVIAEIRRYVRADTRAADTVEALLEQVPDFRRIEVVKYRDGYECDLYQGDFPSRPITTIGKTPAEAIKRALEGVK